MAGYQLNDGEYVLFRIWNFWIGECVQLSHRDIIPVLYHKPSQGLHFDSVWN